MNFKWPAKPEYTFEESYPESHLRAYTEKTLTNLGTEQIDLMQFILGMMVSLIRGVAKGDRRSKKRG